MLSKSLRVPAVRGALSSLRPSVPNTSILQRHIAPALIQTRCLSDEVRSAIDKAVASAPVVLFMKGTPETPQCGFSRATIQLLGQQGLDPRKFTAFNVLEDEELRAGMFMYMQDYGASMHGATETNLPMNKGIKEYSDWPTIPQLYVEKEFVGGCDILMSMHKDGSLAQLLTEKKLIVEDDSA